MSKTSVMYFEKEDILHLVISEEPEARSIELGPNITAELNEKGELIGVEIVNAAAFLRDSILESIQFKMLESMMPGAVASESEVAA
ncbi:MAG: DUF2283 domain-containing protein [Ardenticatenales bacterium]|nr:DUF2283 domain-containing protein [Ardenticatenales bacterium]